MALHSSTSSALRFLQLELKKLQEEPVEGFKVRLPDDCNIFVWEVGIFGPPETLYEGGYFKVCFVRQFVYRVTFVMPTAAALELVHPVWSVMAGLIKR